MATFEENILAYLDGSLGGADRDEVLHAVSISPEKRALLDAHLRLGDLFTIVQKPISAPLQVQRDLASKVPVLAVKLPYLAEPAVGRRSLMAPWIVIATVALILGGVWFGFDRSLRVQQPSASLFASQSAPMPQTVPSIKSFSAMNPTTGNGTPEDNNFTSSKISGSSLHKKGIPVRSELPSSPASVIPNDRPNRDAAPAMPADSIAQNSSPHLDENISSLAISQPTIAFHNSRIAPVGYDIEKNEEHYSPFHFFVAGQTRYVTKPKELSSHVIDSGIGVTNNRFLPAGIEIGVDYELSPWLSAGLRGGSAAFLQLQPFPYSVSVPGYPYLTQHITDASVNSTMAYWSGLALSYELNPQDQLHFAASVIGGAAFIAGLSPMGMLELSGGYELSSLLSLRGSVSVDYSQVKPGSLPPSSGTSSHALGIINQGPGTGTLATTALGFSVGIFYHP